MSRHTMGHRAGISTRRSPTHAEFEARGESDACYFALNSAGLVTYSRRQNTRKIASLAILQESQFRWRPEDVIQLTELYKDKVRLWQVH